MLEYSRTKLICRSPPSFSSVPVQGRASKPMRLALVGRIWPSRSDEKLWGCGAFSTQTDLYSTPKDILHQCRGLYSSDSSNQSISTTILFFRCLIYRKWARFKTLAADLRVRLPGVTQSMWGFITCCVRSFASLVMRRSSSSYLSYATSSLALTTSQWHSKNSL